MSNYRPTDEAEIRDFIENWARAVCTKDLDGVIANHSPDILLAFGFPPSKGIEAYKKTWELVFSWPQESWLFDVSEVNITAGDNVAFATALIRWEEMWANGNKVECDFHLTTCFRKIDARWTVVHEHLSQ